MHSWRNSNPTRWFRLQNKTENNNLSYSLSAITIPEQSHLGRVRVFTNIMSYKWLLMTWAASTLSPRNLKTDVSLWKHQMFSLYTTPEELKNATSPVILNLYLEKTRSDREITWRRRGHCVQRVPFSKFFLSTRKQKVGKFFQLKSGRFQKAPFSRRISVDGRPNRRNKAAFQIPPQGEWLFLLSPARSHARTIST